MSYKIRKAGEDDIERLLELRLFLLHEVGELTAESDIEKVRRASKEYLYTTLSKGDFISFVAESDKQIIATSGVVSLYSILQRNQRRKNMVACIRSWKTVVSKKRVRG
jgi:hypothetical protein